MKTERKETISTVWTTHRGSAFKLVSPYAIRYYNRITNRSPLKPIKKIVRYKRNDMHTHAYRFTVLYRRNVPGTWTEAESY